MSRTAADYMAETLARAVLEQMDVRVSSLIWPRSI
jgi:hypothetical protein